MSILQLALVLLYMVLYMYDFWNTQIFPYTGQPILNGFIVGLIMGNPVVGLQIGATLQLMQLGGAGFGGASYVEYDVGAVIGTMVAASSGGGVEYGLAIGLPVSLMMIQIDVLTKMACTFFLQKSHKEADKENYSAAFRWLHLGGLPWAAKAMLPVLLVFFIGPDRIAGLVSLFPDWIMGPLTVAGGLLPAIGIAILLRYMNAGKYLPFLIFGFVAMSYLGLSIIGVSLVGVAIAILVYKNEQNKKLAVVAAGEGELEDEFD